MTSLLSAYDELLVNINLNIKATESAISEAIF